MLVSPTPFRKAVCLLGLAVALAACRPQADVVGTRIGSLRNVISDVQVRLPGAQNFVRAAEGDPVVIGSLIRTADNSLARAAFDNQATLRMLSNTTLAVEDPLTPEDDIRLTFTLGRLLLGMHGRRLRLETPIATVALQGFAEAIYLTGTSQGLEDDVLIIKCFTGPCRLVHAGVETNVNHLEQALVSLAAQRPLLEPLTELALTQFLSDLPGSAVALATLTAAPSATLSPTPAISSTPSPTLPIDSSLGQTITPAAGLASATATATVRATRPPLLPTWTMTSSATPLPTNTQAPPPPPPPTNPPPPTSTPIPPTNTPLPTDTYTPPPPPPPSKTPTP